MLISLNGPMGVGKSTFTEVLREKGYASGGELKIFPKSVNLYYNNPEYYSYIVHSQFIIERIILEIDLVKENNFTDAIFDKHIADLYVYAEYSYSKGYISIEELNSLYLFYNRYKDSLIPIDLCVVMNTSNDRLMKNLLKRGREYEMGSEMLEFCMDFSNNYSDNFKKVSSKLGLKNVIYTTLDSNDIKSNSEKVLKLIKEGDL